MFEEEKRSVGRPKLANAKLKKNSIILCIICLILVVALLIGGAYKLNIIKLKGDSSNKFEIGDKFCLGSECFYTIDDDGTTITALAKYNLLVGYTLKKEDGYNDNSPLYEIDENQEGYGLQSYRALGYSYQLGDNERIGLVAFSKKADGSENIYWWQNGDVASEYTNKYPFVYDSNATIYGYVNDYKTKLNDMGYNVKDATLLSKEQAVDLGCDNTSSNFSNRCLNAPSWVYTSSYWLGTAYQSYPYMIQSNSYIAYLYSASSIFGAGVRPVIKINKSDIPKDRGLNKNYNIGDEVCIKSECFNVIGKDTKKNEVALFAKYNLLLGYDIKMGEEYERFNKIDESTSGYGMQSKDAIVNANEQSIYGGVSFIKVSEEQRQAMINGDSPEFDYYWMNGEDVDSSYKKEITLDDNNVVYYDYYNEQSNLYNYIENYKTKLSSISGIKIKEARIPDLTDYYYFLYNNLWENWEKPGFYWTSVAFEDDSINVGTENFNEEGFEGPSMPPYAFMPIRPVLVVNIDELNKTPQQTTTTTKRQEIVTKPATNKVIHRYVYDVENPKNNTTTTIKTTTNKNSNKNFGNKVVINQSNKTNWWIIIIGIVDGALFMAVLLLLKSLLSKKKRH